VTERHYQVVERQTALGGGTAISGGGTPDTGGGMPFRLNLTTGFVYIYAVMLRCAK